MIIIEIEGLDKSGKHSQAELLHQALYEKGVNVVSSEFHRYDTPTGDLIRRYLDGTYDPGALAIEMIMAADKYAQVNWFKELSENVDVLILDRYISSQLFYGIAKGMEIDFITTILGKLPEPTYSIFIDIEPEESMKRKGKHGENDRYERDKELLTRVRSNYLIGMTGLAKEERALIVDGNQSIKEIHDNILSAVLPLINLDEGE